MEDDKKDDTERAASVRLVCNMLRYIVDELESKGFERDATMIAEIIKKISGKGGTRMECDCARVTFH